MKTSRYPLPRARVYVLLLALTTLPAHDALCGSPLKRVLGAIKGRVEHVIHKIGNSDEDSRSNQQALQERSLEYGPPSTVIYQSAPRPPQQSSNPYDPNGSVSENISPSVAGQPAIILSKPQQSATSPVDPRIQEQQQQLDANNRPALRDLPMNEASRPPASPAISTAQGSRNPADSQVSPSETQIKYAKAVPSHPGFVYPPGVTEELKNMLDVRGCASGEKMRDPRNGNVFLVP